MHIILSALSGIIAVGMTIPYVIDIQRGRVRPSRSTRAMLALLLIAALGQQITLGADWSLTLTLVEMLSAVLLFILSIAKGSGGLDRFDVICYALLALDLMLWALTQNALLALHLTVFADLIAFSPTLIKTWRIPSSETAGFWLGGAVAAVFAALAESRPCYATLLFPGYLFFVNLIEAWLVMGWRLESVRSQGG